MPAATTVFGRSIVSFWVAGSSLPQAAMKTPAAPTALAILPGLAIKGGGS